MLSSRLIAVSFAGLFAANAFAHDHADKPNIIETAEAAGSFTTLLTAIETAGLTETLATGGPFTVFAPHRRSLCGHPRSRSGRNPGRQ